MGTPLSVLEDLLSSLISVCSIFSFTPAARIAFTLPKQADARTCAAHVDTAVSDARRRGAGSRGSALEDAAAVCAVIDLLLARNGGLDVQSGEGHGASSALM